LYVTKCSDELWLGVKCQTNLEIAGSRRNNFRVSASVFNRGGRALNEVGAYPATELNQTPNAAIQSLVVGLREMSFVVERERTQTVD
jgi:hypothetical protein